MQLKIYIQSINSKFNLNPKFKSTNPIKFIQLLNPKLNLTIFQFNYIKLYLLYPL